MKKNLILILLLFICLNIIPQTKKEYIVGVENIKYYPLYSYDGKEWIGYAREILDAFANKKGYKFNYVALPVARLFNDFVISQTIDFKFPDNPYWSADLKKDKKVIYSKSVVDYIEGVIVLPERKGKSLENLKTLGTIMGFTAWDYLDLIKTKKITLKENTDFDVLLLQTINKNIDGAYINIVVADYHLNEILKKPEALIFDETLPYTKSSYFFASIKYPHIIEEFNKFLEEEKDFVAKVKAKYKVEEKVKKYHFYKK